MMLRYSLNMEKPARDIEKAVEKVLAEGHRTADIAGREDTPVSTGTMGDLITTAYKQL